jgi:hypothetical protein
MWPSILVMLEALYDGIQINMSLDWTGALLLNVLFLHRTIPFDHIPLGLKLVVVNMKVV